MNDHGTEGDGFRRRDLDYGGLCHPEVRGLFEEWAKAVEEEILAFLKEKGKANPSDISAKLSISEESALFFIGKMAREGKITLGEIRIGK